jgi:predicted nuclease of predicted toxin-antitoxin system
MTTIDYHNIITIEPGKRSGKPCIRGLRITVDVFPDSAHVDRIGLGGGSDDDVWCYAKENGFMIVSKDSDFYEKSILYGHPPKVILIKRGNCNNRQIQLILRNKIELITEFYQNDHVSFIRIN